MPVAFALHNAEEACTVGSHLARLRDALRTSSLPVWLPSEPEYLSALAIATGLSVVLLAVAWWWDQATAGLVVLQIAMALNVSIHVVTAVTVQDYVPGLWTALVVQVPMTVLVLRRVLAAGWLSHTAWTRVCLAALALHGPGLWLLLASVRAG